jgi:valyl-tRNA synthetase
MLGKYALVPVFGQRVPILPDPAADPAKGSGAVMCCTFGDSADVAWWMRYKLPLVEVIDREGKMLPTAGLLSGLTILDARMKVIQTLQEQGRILDRQQQPQTIRIHERCDSAVEYIVTPQWFIRLLEHKQKLLTAGETLLWHPSYMQSRYQAWVQNLNWDWCISRQRYFGVAIPVWYCARCGETILADEADLPVSPTEQQSGKSCPACGSRETIAESDVLDTWATSSLTPLICAGWQKEEDSTAEFFRKVFPFSLRPQSHEIIRTWAFYTIVKSLYHLGELPWRDVMISGWGIAGEGMGKISKSRGGGPMPPLEMIDRYSADAVRYWAASTSTGMDAVISEERVQMGIKFVNKLWNVARFCEPFIEGRSSTPTPLTYATPADRWLLARLQQVIRQCTLSFEGYDYASAKHELENFFWHDFADNYIEMCKQRLYDHTHPQRVAACFTVYEALFTLLKLCAPFFPFVTEEIFQNLFVQFEGTESIHRLAWPESNPSLDDPYAGSHGDLLVAIASGVRRYKSEHNLPLSTELSCLRLTFAEPELNQWITAALPDLISITRAKRIEIEAELPDGIESHGFKLKIELANS